MRRAISLGHVNWICGSINFAFDLRCDSLAVRMKSAYRSLHTQYHIRRLEAFNSLSGY